MPSATNAGRSSFTIFSPKAELAKNALAARQKVGRDETESGEEAAKQLPDEECLDFLSTYEDDHWWHKPQVDDTDRQSKL
jgi:hypothetical protein